MITWNTGIDAHCIGGIVNGDGRTVLIKTNWDYPTVAECFGWSLRSVQVKDAHVECDHDHTNGTVDCPDCGAKVSDFVAAAAEWLRDNNGAEADDPGYFDDD